MFKSLMVPFRGVAWFWKQIGRIDSKPVVIIGRTVVAGGLAYLAFETSWVTVRPIYQWSTASYETVLVTDKWQKTNPETGKQQYLVSLKHKDGRDTTASIEDSWIWWTFNSSDRYGALSKDKDATIKLAGLRFGFLSWYPNIVRVK